MFDGELVYASVSQYWFRSQSVRKRMQLAPLTADARADSVVVLKKERKLILYSQGQVLKTYPISLGSEPIGPKTHQGDHRTPEGHYVLDSRNPKSQYYRSIHISYPKPGQVENARKQGTCSGRRCLHSRPA